MTLLLTADQVKSLSTMRDVIEANDYGFRQHALGQALMPQRLAIHLERTQGVMLTMAAFVDGPQSAMGVKNVTVFPNNIEKHGLPTTIGLMILNDAESGAPLAVMDATHLTAMRTGAGGGVATKYLARKDASTVGIFGSGVQAETQLMAACSVRPIRKACVFSRNYANAEAFAVKMSKALDIEIVPVKDPKDAVAGMHIIATATTATQPLFDGAWLEPGQHVNAVGTHLPTARELDTFAVARSGLFVDSRKACLIEAGEIVVPIQDGTFGESHIKAEIGEVAAGLRPGRQSDDEITIFKSVGVGIQDVTAAFAVFESARQQGVGVDFPF